MRIRLLPIAAIRRFARKSSMTDAAMTGLYGFICGYCETMLDTPFDDHDSAAKFAQQQGWRMTFGSSPRWGLGANYTCPDCITPNEEVSSIWVD